MIKSIGIIGEGSWGTALLKILQQNGSNVNWLIRFDEMYQAILNTAHNPSYLSDVEIDLHKVTLYNDVHQLIQNSDLIFLVLPSAFTEYLFYEIQADEVQNKYFISATKGILPTSHLTISQYLNHKLSIHKEHIGFISGPSHAEEIAMERLTYLTILSENDNLRKELIKLLENRFIKVKENTDVVGAEYATALKNIMAIATGIVHSLGFGDNFIAVLVSNAIKEI